MDDVKINWYRTKIDGPTMKALTTRSDLLGTAHALGQLALLGASGYFTWFAWNHLSWPWVVLGFMLLGTFHGFATQAAACHELSHGTAFKTRWLNNIFFWVFCFISWTNPIRFWTSHKRHHLYTLHAPWDREIVLPAPPVRWPFYLQMLTIDWGFLKMVMRNHFHHAFGKLETDWEKAIFPESDGANRRALFNWARFQILGHAGLIALFAATGQWILIPIIALPFYFHVIPFMTGMPQHFGLQARVPDFRYSCRTMLLGPILRYLYWHMNYHTEHHMFPGVPYYNLGKVHQLVQADGGAPPCRGIVGAWKEMLMIQRRQMQQPGIAYDQYSRGKEPAFIPQEGNGPRPTAAAA